MATTIVIPTPVIVVPFPAGAPDCCCGGGPCSCDDLPDTMWLTAEAWMADDPHPLSHYDPIVIPVVKGNGLPGVFNCECPAPEELEYCWGGMWAFTDWYYVSRGCVSLACEGAVYSSGDGKPGLLLWMCINVEEKVSCDPVEYRWVGLSDQCFAVPVLCEEIANPGSTDPICVPGRAHLRNVCAHVKAPS